MEPVKGDVPKLPDMVMCGDHPSFTKTELNIKEPKLKHDDKDKINYSKITSSQSSRTGAGILTPLSSGASQETSRLSDHNMKIDQRRRVRSLEAVPKGDIEISTPNRALLQAALGSFRWPPYLVCVWVVVLVLTHALHCALTLLERALPPLKKLCVYCRCWTEETWKLDADSHRVYPLALALLTGVLYSFYFGLHLLYSIAVWAVEPLYPDGDDKQSNADILETRVTNYVDEVISKTNIKH